MSQVPQSGISLAPGGQPFSVGRNADTPNFIRVAMQGIFLFTFGQFPKIEILKAARVGLTQLGLMRVEQADHAGKVAVCPGLGSQPYIRRIKQAARALFTVGRSEE